ncbi:MAG: type 1 glutamine amidotransferase, partial [Candidatus Levybacteria bacterium]|nr:type 1 glutamine amidotransferase [Candidatus Levybacteria bacterium]
MSYTLTIGWLYPELMSTYGDRGNIITLARRCEWRRIKVDIINLDLGFKTADLRKCDFLFMGGAQDRQQTIVAKDLRLKIKDLREMIEKGIPGLYICGAYQFLGKYYKEADGTIIPGLDILDLYTENPGENHPRLIGNIAIKSNVMYRFVLAKPIPYRNSFAMRDDTLVGFENHGGRTYLGRGIEPLGKVITGFGNNGEDGTEGAVYKNSFGTYLHGPILPKNPHFADYLIQKALEKKYKSAVELKPLDDSLELQAHEA